MSLIMGYNIPSNKNWPKKNGCSTCPKKESKAGWCSVTDTKPMRKCPFNVRGNV